MTPENIRKANSLIDKKEVYENMLEAGVGEKITITAQKSIIKGGQVHIQLDKDSAPLYANLIKYELSLIYSALKELGVE